MSVLELMRGSWSKAQVVAAVERPLQQLAERGYLEGHPGVLAGLVVEQARVQQPLLFDGDLGSRPHKVAAAAIVLAIAMRLQAQERNEALRDAYTLALGLILDEIARNAHQYAFSELDYRLLDGAAATYSEPAEQLLHAPRLDWYGL